MTDCKHVRVSFSMSIVKNVPEGFEAMQAKDNCDLESYETIQTTSRATCDLCGEILEDTP